MTQMTSQPWRAKDARPGSYAIGMLGLDERKLLYHLARDFYSGGGAVIDLGSFCGASTCCLAAGLRENPRTPKGKVLHAYDMFQVTHEYLVAFLRDRFGKSLSFGASFRPIFEEVVREFADLIETHEGDLLTATWPESEPIEILFIDAAKTIRVNEAILNTFFPRLVPGQSLVIQQDFHHPSTYYLVVVMDFLRDHFEVVEEMADYSAAWRLVSAIPTEKLRRASKYEFSYSEQRAALRRMRRSFQPQNRHNLRLAEATFFGMHHDKAALDLAVSAVSKQRRPPDDAVWAQNLTWLESIDDEAMRTFAEETLARSPYTSKQANWAVLAWLKTSAALRGILG